MLAKYINENQVDYDRSKIILDKKLIINPTDEQLRQAEYMDVIEEEYQENSQRKYFVEEGKIVQRYIPIQIPETEQALETEQKPTQEQALRIFAQTLADADTNSIAKIRAAAQEFLNNTEESL